jgi:peptidoglycan-N-acetylglucosamine deacetylase
MRFQLVALLSVGLVVGGCTADMMPEASGVPTDDESAAWNSAAEENQSGKADTTGCSGVVIPDRNGFHKHIALTFDDGPNLATTPTVLATLAKHNAKATFFVNGGNVATTEKKALLKQMADEGHFIGNHSHNHKNLKNESSSSVESQVSLTQNLLTGLGIKQRYFRFPFGSASCQSASIVRNHGYAITGWHIDSADWCYSSGKGGVGHCDASVFKYVESQYRDDMVGYIVSQAKSVGGGVLLMHDIHKYTVSMLDEVLTQLEEEGFSFVALDDTSTFPLLNGAKPSTSAWIGTPCTSDATCKFSAGNKTGTCHDFTANGKEVGFCTIACEGYCPDQSGKAPSFCVSLDGATGSCVSKASEDNHQCADIPGTSAAKADRFIGSSTASASSATVCLPE